MAAIKGTEYYSSKFVNLKFNRLGSTNLKVSACGFGGYRIDHSIQIHKEALKHAISNGINLIDTSSNYSNGGSELLVGEVLNEMISKGEISRDEIVVVSKGGYIQGDNLKEAKERESKGILFPDVVKCSPDLWHCIHPDFLENQITASLKRMKLDYVDVYLLHNPEYFLSCSPINDLGERREEFYLRIKKAFEFLETQVSKGRISFYGVSSNTFGELESKEKFISFEKIFNSVQNVSTENHFAVVQLPINLFEKGAVVNLNQANRQKRVIDLCAEYDVALLANRPLNAIIGNKLYRLADFKIKEDRSEEEVKLLIEETVAQEIELLRNLTTASEISAEEKNVIKDCLTVGTGLRDNYNSFDSISQFIEIKGYYLIPRANYAIDQLSRYFPDNESLIHSLNTYAAALNVLLNSVESLLAKKHNEKNLELHRQLAKYMNEEQKTFSLAQKSLLMLNSIKEVSSVLVGMRKKEYVNDVIKCINKENIINAYEYWR